MPDKPFLHTLNPLETDHLTKVWTNNPDIIKRFLDQRPHYEQLCNEIAYTLGKRMDKSNTEYAAITSRAKTLNSFLEKLNRKSYLNPFEGITDFAGVRLVYLYKSDQAAIEKLVEKEFKVTEKVNKIEEQGTDRFGYGALHYLVRLGPNNSGARYDDLKGLLCEIQVRTVLQDAWAIVQHHLIYKHESEIPGTLKRRLNAVSGSFETADNEFDQVRVERNRYLETVRRKKNDEQDFLNQDINLDTLREYLRWRFPNGKETFLVHFNGVFELTQTYSYLKLRDLQDLLRKTEGARLHYFSDNPTENDRRQDESGAGEYQIAVALAMVHPEYLRKMPEPFQQRLLEAAKYIEA